MAVTTKKITTVDTATTFDDVFVNTNGTLRQVTKENFQQASGITALNNKKALNLDKETSSIYSGDLNDLIETGSWLLTSNNANRPVQNQWLTLVVFRSYKDANGEVVTQFAYGRDDKALYVRMKSGNTWIEWTKIPSRAEVDANTAAITALNSRIIYDSNALSASGSVLGYLNKLSNGVRAYVHTWQTTSDMPSGLPGTTYVFKFVTDAANRIYDYVILTRINSGEQWLGKVNDANLSTRTLSWVKFPSRAEMDALNSRLNYKVIQTQLVIPSSVSIDAGASGTVFSNADLRTYTVNALDALPTSGTLKAASYLWSNAAACVTTDILVQNGKLTMTLRNITPESVTITAVRLLLIYEL